MTDLGDTITEKINALVVQPDGRLVAAGGRFLPGSRADLVLARYNADGSLDASFGAGGLVVGPESSIATGLVLQSDGKLVAVGHASLFRFHGDGTLDMSFGGDGSVRHSVFSVLQHPLVLQSDGKLVTAGSRFGVGCCVERFALERFNSDGSADTSFGSGGVVVTDFGEESEAYALVVQADGKLVAAGGVGAFDFGFLSRPDFIVVRYNADGSLDTSFGSGSAVVLSDPHTSFSSIGSPLALQRDGKLVAGGRGSSSGDADFALVRYVTTNEPLAVPPTCSGRPATILGTSGNDTLRGTSGPDVILGRGGNDTIRGLEGDDIICGGPGRDRLIGNAGNDRLLGEGQNDKLFGDSGRDRLDGGSGRDACRTGERARRCEGKPASSKPTSGERPKDPPKPLCPPVSNFPCS